MTNNTTKTLKALAVAALALLGTTSVAGPTRADPNDDQILVSRLHDDGFGGPVENLVDDGHRVCSSLDRENGAQVVADLQQSLPTLTLQNANLFVFESMKVYCPWQIHSAQQPPAFTGRTRATRAAERLGE